MTLAPSHYALDSTRNRRPVELVRFSLVGFSGIGVNLATYYVLTRAAALPIEAASPLAIELSVIWNFLANDRWTFGGRLTERGPAGRFARFHVVCLAAAVINYAMLLILANGAGWWDIYANLFGIAAGAVAKFAVNSAWTWREPKVPLGSAPLTLPGGGAR